MGHKCCVCGNTRTKDSSVSFHRFPKEQKRRSLWLVYIMDGVHQLIEGIKLLWHQPFNKFALFPRC